VGTAGENEDFSEGSREKIENGRRKQGRKWYCEKAVGKKIANPQARVNAERAL